MFFLFSVSSSDCLSCLHLAILFFNTVLWAVLTSWSTYSFSLIDRLPCWRHRTEGEDDQSQIRPSESGSGNMGQSIEYVGSLWTTYCTKCLYFANKTTKKNMDSRGKWLRKIMGKKENKWGKQKQNKILIIGRKTYLSGGWHDWFVRNVWGSTTAWTFHRRTKYLGTFHRLDIQKLFSLKNIYSFMDNDMFSLHFSAMTIEMLIYKMSCLSKVVPIILS